MDTYSLESNEGMVSLDTNSSKVEGMNEIKNVDEPQEEMAEFSTPISDLMPDPDIVQKETPVVVSPLLKDTMASGAAKKKKKGGLSPEQMDAVVAGIAAVVAFSKPVQDKVMQFVPGQGLPAMLLTALIAAVVFFFGKRFMSKRTA
jgi:hypothetical protein